MMFRCCQRKLFRFVGFLAVLMLSMECEAFVIRRGSARGGTIPFVSEYNSPPSKDTTTSLKANNNNNNNDYPSINIGQILQTATFGFGLSFLALSFILPEFGYDFVVQENGRLGIGTVTEAQFQRETIKANKEAKAQQELLKQSSSE
ncbi:expressed unknown protein [Seminavis robusta]|uniref:Uncharacterized protein n=1 Tax=Seminavis robusta TaxID=568900 RepID=A0A9N8E4M0_9STRA|nr:expressed unknown protein [Seminavis robusta]|eukprot:Sro544_g163740.1 n/a (147) ;mRNA; f:58283-58723